MNSTGHHPHTCVYFDDGELDLLCACGERAMYLDDAMYLDSARYPNAAADGSVVVALVSERSAVTRLHRSVEELAVSA